MANKNGEEIAIYYVYSVLGPFCLCSVHAIHNPVDVMRDTGVYAGVTGLCALVSERDHAQKVEFLLLRDHKRAARITLSVIDKYYSIAHE